MAKADLARFIARWTIEFIRVYPHPIERVWRAISDPAEVAVRFIPPKAWDLRSGGSYRLLEQFGGAIELVDPPRRIRFRYAPIAGPWPGADAYFQFDLETVSGGFCLCFVLFVVPVVFVSVVFCV